jgi:hypothetical protein
MLLSPCVTKRSPKPAPEELPHVACSWFGFRILPLYALTFRPTRALVVERWLAVYRITQIGVQIVRIVDGACDLSNLELPSE